MTKAWISLVLVLLLAAFGAPAAARGLAFDEQMHGTAFWNGEFRYLHFTLDIRIDDIDAWRSSPAHAARVIGTLRLDDGAAMPITGELQILAPAPNDDGRLLVYRLGGTQIRFLGAKRVHDDGGFDLIDDVTTLHGTLLAPTAPWPALADVVYGARWTAEVQFEWWRPTVVLAFLDSFETIATPWYERWWVEWLFIETTFGAVAGEFFFDFL